MRFDYLAVLTCTKYNLFSLSGHFCSQWNILKPTHQISDFPHDSVLVRHILLFPLDPDVACNILVLGPEK